MSNRLYTIALAVAFLCVCFSHVRGEADLDRVFTPQLGFYSACNKGIGDAGIALPWNMASALLNPALLYACRNGSAPVSRSLYVGYARDSLFDRYVLPVGLSYARRRSAVALQARFLSSGFGPEQQEANLTFSRRQLRKAHPMGPLDIGVNLRYNRARWETRYLDTLYTVRSYVDTLGRVRRPDAIVGQSVPPAYKRFREQQAMVDIGVFKPECASHLDAGVVVKNLFAWRTGTERPAIVVSTDTAGIIGDTLVMIDREMAYDAAARRYGGWVAGRYAVLAGGWNFRIGNPAGLFSLSIPFEVRAYGLFDRSVKELYAIHAGLQVHVMNDIFVRAGYERSPGQTPEGAGELLPVHNLSFGVAVLPLGLPAVVDCYVTHQEWGVSVAVDY